MTMLLTLPPVCCATVVVMSFLGIQPIIMACAMPFVVGGCWVIL